MSNVDTRQVNRDSLFLLAQLRVDGQDALYRVKVRNLSAGGMMAEGEAKVMRGSLVVVELRNIGWVEGSVAWKHDEPVRLCVRRRDRSAGRASARRAAGADYDAPRYTRNNQAVPIDSRPTRRELRKI